MEWKFANLSYWFVDHPMVKEFEWNEGQTFGASTQFLATSVIAYLSFTALLNSYYKSNNISPIFASWLRIIKPIHNLLLLILSFIMAIGAILSMANQMPNYRWLVCFPPDNMSRRGPIFFWGYIYYLSKIIEFSDTFLIILCGGAKRLTFLHVYHHTAVFIMSYIYLHTAQSLFPFGIVVNSCVHMLMYTYYMMCSLGSRPVWKRLVTDCQISQFLFGILMAGIMLWFHFEENKGGCSGIWGIIYNLAFVLTLLGLFTDFHRKNYAKKNK